MSLTQEEKSFIQESIQVYIQIVARQTSQQQLQQIASMAEKIIKKLDTIGNSSKGNSKPAGITDEWFKKVCKTCDKLSPTGCTDKVTEKFPGKCDPILHYEQTKLKGKH